MNKQREALELALAALCYDNSLSRGATIVAVREALAETGTIKSFYMIDKGVVKVKAEVLKSAIEAMEGLIKYNYHGEPREEEDEAGMQAIRTLREVLTQPPHSVPRTRKPLTDDELKELWKEHGYKSAMCMKFARAIEKKIRGEYE